MKKLLLVAGMCALLALAGCARPTVVVYTDVDRPFVEQLFRPFTQRTGIAVDIVHCSSVESLIEKIATTDGNGYRLITHNGSLSPDLVLSAEMFTGDVLRVRGAVQSYQPAGAEAIPSGAKSESMWYGVGARPWVLMWNTHTIARGFEPHSLMDLASERIQLGGVCTVPPTYNPYYTSAVAVARGKDAAISFFQTLIDRQAAFVTDPEQAAQRIAQGQAQVGLTTLAAAQEQQQAGAPIAWAIPDQRAGEIGAFAPFYSVCLLKNATHPEDGRQAEDYLLSIDAQKQMVALGMCDATLRDCGLSAPIVTPLAVPLEEASQAYNDDLVHFLEYFRHYGPQPTASAGPEANNTASTSGR